MRGVWCGRAKERFGGELFVFILIARSSSSRWSRRSTINCSRAYLLKEQLREVFRLKGEEGKHLLDSWLGWAQRCRIPTFVELGRRISKHRQAIDATLDHRPSNGLVESTNTKIRLLTRMAFGFKSPEAMIAVAMLNLGGYCPPLPGRQAASTTHGTSRRAPNLGACTPMTTASFRAKFFSPRKACA